jgi:hypothetical protein
MTLNFDALASIASGQKPVFGTANIGQGINDLLRALNQMIIFDPAVVDPTLGALSIAQVEAAGAVSNLKAGLYPSVFIFFTQPTVLKRAIKKTTQRILEKKGWDTVHFPETSTEMIPMAFAGTTGSLVPPAVLTQQGIWDTKYSINWMRFKQFEGLVLNARNDMKMIYDGSLYEGYIEGLTYDENSEAPFGIKYSFTFWAYPDRTQGLSSPNTLVTSIPVANTVLQTGFGP